MVFAYIDYFNQKKLWFGFVYIDRFLLEKVMAEICSCCPFLNLCIKNGTIDILALQSLHSELFLTFSPLMLKKTLKHLLISGNSPTFALAFGVIANM